MNDKHPQVFIHPILISMLRHKTFDLMFDSFNHSKAGDEFFETLSQCFQPPPADQEEEHRAFIFTLGYTLLKLYSTAKS